MRAGFVTLDGAAGVFPAMLEDATWNGFACPFFDLATAQAVAASFAREQANDPPEMAGCWETWTYDPDIDAFVPYCADYEPLEQNSPVPGEEFADGTVRYPIGAWAYTWTECDAQGNWI